MFRNPFANIYRVSAVSCVLLEMWDPQVSAALWGDASNLGLTPAEDHAEREKLASVSILLQRLDD